MLEIRKNEQQISTWIILTVFLAFSFFMFTYGFMHQTHVKHHGDVYITVKSGMSADDVANLLYERNVIDSVIGFKIIAKMNALDSELKAGEYAFSKDMSYSTIVDILVKGEISANEIRVTVPEGYNINQIGKILEEKGITTQKDFEKAAKDFAPYEYISLDSQAQYRVEGFLFPDTYQFSRKQSSKEILGIMTKEFNDKLTEEMRERANQMGLSIRELVILASLVEKEAQVDEDRPIIAQVFMNRLKEHMPLQSCATIQYILGFPKPELSLQDTKIESPYNTYQNMGLPPGPIANPGVESIKAVLYSTPTDYLYFVADKNGKHHFSKTYEEHLLAIDRIG
ncbi:endolytic transglycosylase MltG [Anaerosinus sp.]|uniref:endolytic transglycosylase MltG n=1 Tax=Selenobaculum sp. TaxID=3074374 RepID=UPI0015B11D7C